MSNDQTAKLLYEAIMAPSVSADTKAMLIDALDMLKDDVNGNAGYVEMLKNLRNKLIEDSMGLEPRPVGPDRQADGKV